MKIVGGQPKLQGDHHTYHSSEPVDAEDDDDDSN